MSLLRSKELKSKVIIGLAEKLKFDLRSLLLVSSPMPHLARGTRKAREPVIKRGANVKEEA